MCHEILLLFYYVLCQAVNNFLFDPFFRLQKLTQRMFISDIPQSCTIRMFIETFMDISQNQKTNIIDFFPFKLLMHEKRSSIFYKSEIAHAQVANILNTFYRYFVIRNLFFSCIFGVDAFFMQLKLISLS